MTIFFDTLGLELGFPVLEWLIIEALARTQHANSDIDSIIMLKCQWLIASSCDRTLLFVLAATADSHFLLIRLRAFDSLLVISDFGPDEHWSDQHGNRILGPTVSGHVMAHKSRHLDDLLSSFTWTFNLWSSHDLVNSWMQAPTDYESHALPFGPSEEQLYEPWSPEHLWNEPETEDEVFHMVTMFPVANFDQGSTRALRFIKPLRCGYDVHQFVSWYGTTWLESWRNAMPSHFSG